MSVEAIGFPLDATEYTASALGGWHGGYTRGVFCDDDAFPVTAAGGMNIRVGEGLAVVLKEKYWPVNVIFEGDSFTLSTAHTNLPRVDAVCVQLDKNQNKAFVTIKTGTPATSPVPPAIQRASLDYDEIYPFLINVPAGSTAVTAANIRDCRADETWCGFVGDGIRRIPTQALYDQWQTWFSELQATANDRYTVFNNLLTEYQNSAKNTHDTYVARVEELLQEYIDKLLTLEAISVDKANKWYDSFTTGFEQKLQEWFERLQDTLNENQAAELFNKIDKHERLAIFKDEVHGAKFSNGSLWVWDGSGWVAVAGSGGEGLSWDYLDDKGYTWNELEAFGHTWNEFEQLLERRTNARSWESFNARGATVAQLNSTGASWEDISLAGTGVDATGSSGKTERLGLSLWEAQDIPQMEDFNADNEAIEKGFAELAALVTQIEESLSLYALANHSHTAQDVGALPAGGTAANADKLGGKLPSHYATQDDIDRVVAEGGSVAWENVTAKPATFPPAAHIHNEYAAASHSHGIYALATEVATLKQQVEELQGYWLIANE